MSSPKNKRLLIDLEEAIGEYAAEITADCQHKVGWSEHTTKAHKKLWMLLLKLEKVLP